MKSPIALAMAACLAFTGCLATDPDGGPGARDTDFPEDKGRIAGSSSTTNWPPDMGHRLTQYRGRADTTVHLEFREIELEPPFELVPVKRTGTLRVFRSGVIPALESPAPRDIPFQDKTSLSIPTSILDSMAVSAGMDTLSFHIQIESDTLQSWKFGFQYSRSQKAVVLSPFTDSSGNTGYLRRQLWYLRGNLEVDSTILSPVPGSSELCFYIPGTPFFDRPKIGELDSIGPLPQGEYPLRLMRISKATPQATVTLVEAWEVHIVNRSGKELFIPGAKVLSAEIQGVIDLRKAE